jgi:REP element-mobilizing transposase RayT
VPRKPREEEPGAVYHVVVKGNDGQPIVVDDADRREILRRLQSVAERCDWECPAYCLLDTHLHLVVGTPEANLGQGMQWLAGRYAFRFNRRHGRHGHLFDGPYYARGIVGESHFVKACLYIVLNPVAAGLCSHPRYWRWSSYSGTLDSACADVGDPHLLLWLLDDDLARARVRYRELVDEAVRELRLGERLVPG